MDAYSKWLEVEMVNSANTTTIVEKLKRIFATHGLPSTVVSDNGSALTSEEFSTFVNRNGIRHIRTTPYHPAPNGQAVQIFKEGIKQCTTGSLETRVNRFLFHYRTTPHTTTGVTSAELLMGRHLRTHLDLMHPDLMTDVEKKQERQTQDRNKRSQDREVQPRESVFVKDLPAGSSWIPGMVIEKRGPRSYLIELMTGCVVCRHIDHIRSRAEYSDEVGQENNDDWTDDLSANTEPVTPEPPSTTVDSNPPPRRSTRDRRPPDRLGPYVIVLPLKLTLKEGEV